jgi:6-phosphofructokinase 1
LAPNADPDFGEGRHVIDRSGAAAQAVAAQLQRLLDRDMLPLALGALVRGGAPSAVDRQLGLAFGASAVRALHEGQFGVMVTVDAAGIHHVPLAETLNSVRTVPAGSGFTSVARALGIALGD